MPGYMDAIIVANVGKCSLFQMYKQEQTTAILEAFWFVACTAYEQLSDPEHFLPQRSAADVLG